jgi:hypothetical protein
MDEQDALPVPVPVVSATGSGAQATSSEQYVEYTVRPGGQTPMKTCQLTSETTEDGHR